MATAKKRPAGDPERKAKLAKVYETLKKVRESKTVALKPSKYLREKVSLPDGSEGDFKLRYYQVQGAYHLLVLKRMILGDDVGLGKTVEAIAALGHLLERNPNLRVMIVTPKSTVNQWAGEIRRFTTGIEPVVVETLKGKKKGQGSPLDVRKALYQEWSESPLEEGSPRKVLLLNYALLVRDWNAEGVQPVDEKGNPDPKKPVTPGVLDMATRMAGPNLMVIFDEAQAFSNMRTKTWEVARYLSERAERVVGLTATLLSSNLMEGYCIYKAIKPELFGSKNSFMESFCVTELQSIPGKRQKIPIVVGYRNLAQFRARIDPFFLGRKKQEVSSELPILISKDIECELDDAENRKYAEALNGVLELGDGEIRDYEENKALVALLYCQKVVNSLSLLKYEEGSSVGQHFDFDELDYKDVKVGTLGAKEQALVDLVQDELTGEKIIVYTRFASLVPRLQKILEKIKVKSVAITGKQNDKARAEAQRLFQDTKSDVKVIFITDAGGVGINLQMGKAMVFYDLPWTWGKYVQTLGRLIRIGSPHRGVAVYHLFALRPNTEGSRKTIDHHTYQLLRKKQKLIDQILGEAAAGALDFDKGPSGAMDLLRAMQEEESQANRGPK